MHRHTHTGHWTQPNTHGDCLSETPAGEEEETAVVVTDRC